MIPLLKGLVIEPEERIRKLGNLWIPSTVKRKGHRIGTVTAIGDDPAIEVEVGEKVLYTSKGAREEDGLHHITHERILWIYE